MGKVRRDGRDPRQDMGSHHEVHAERGRGVEEDDYYSEEDGELPAPEQRIRGGARPQAATLLRASDVDALRRSTLAAVAQPEHWTGRPGVTLKRRKEVKGAQKHIEQQQSADEEGEVCSA